MKDMSYILKRVAIGVLIALILMLIRGNLFLQANAKTTIQSGLAIATPTGEPLEDYDKKYFTNIDYNSSNNYRDITALFYYYQKCQTYSCSYASESNDISEPFTMPYMSMGASIYRFVYAFGGSYGYNHLEFDTPYSIAVKFTKDSHLNYEALYTDRTKYYFHIWDNDNNNYLGGSDEFVHVDSLNFYTYTDEQNHEQAVFITQFHLDSSDFLGSSTNLSLYSFEFNTLGCFGTGCTLPTTYMPNILTNSDTNYPHDYQFSNKQVYFVKGLILPYGEYCFDNHTNTGCEVSGNNPFENTAGMDIVHDTDIEVFDELPVCDSLDIACHLNNIVQIIKDFFVRFGNFFRDFINNLKESLLDLFIPSSDYLTDFIDNMTEQVEEQFGFLLYPIQLFSNLIDRFYSLERSSVIDYPGFDYPGTNKKIIPAFTVDLDSYFSSGSLYRLYSIYFTFINGLFVFMFFRLCVKKFNSIFGGTGL